MPKKRFLQIAVTVACLIPICGGIYGILHTSGNDTNIVNNYRYLSGLLMGIGLLFLSSVPNIEKHGLRFKTLTFIVVVGGLARLAGFIMGDTTQPVMYAALVMELLVTPLLCLWQHRISKR